VPARFAFEYAIVRVVPRVEREEFINAGAIVFCEAHGFLRAQVELDEARLRALDPDSDVALVREHLDAIVRVCEGKPADGPIAELPLRERWRWLVAPRSTILQTSAPHSGMCEAPEQALHRLMETLVRQER